MPLGYTPILKPTLPTTVPAPSSWGSQAAYKPPVTQWSGWGAHHSGVAPANPGTPAPAPAAPYSDPYAAGKEATWGNDPYAGANANLPVHSAPAPTQGPPANPVSFPYGTWNNVSQYANPYAFMFPSGGMMDQKATMENIQPYLNPYLDQIIANGTNAIAHSGAGKGLFGSTGNINDIGTWATNATANAYNDASDRFSADRLFGTNNQWKQYEAGVNAGDTAQSNFQNDRGFMFDAYRYQNDQDYRNFWDTYGANWDQYKYGNADFQQRLQDYYKANTGLLGNQMDATTRAMAIYSTLGDAIAKLWGDRGNIGMQGAANSGNNNSSLLDSVIGIIPMLMGGLG